MAEPNKLELLLEAERRGILPEDKASLLAEARRRGLINPPSETVLREQPGTFERATSPGGIASPENLGILSGGLMGAARGAAFGPYGAALGGVIGAGAGAGLGRITEMVKERLYGPSRTPGNLPEPEPKKRSFLESAGEVGEATQRGMMTEALGQGFGGVTGRVIQKIKGPVAKAFGPPARRAQALSESTGIPLTAAELLEGTKAGTRIAIAERQPPRYIFGAAKAQEFATKRMEKIESGVLKMADDISPGTEKDVQTIGEMLKDRAGMLAAVTETRVKQIFPKETDLLTAGEGVRTAKRTLFERANESAGRHYDRVRALAGKDADVIDAPNLIQAAQSLTSREAMMKGMQTKGARVAGAIERTVEPSEAVVGGQVVDPGQLPAQLVKQLGLDKPKAFSFDALREWQSRLGELIRNEKNRRARRDWTQMFVAVTKDIDEFGERHPGLQPMLQQANEFYKTKVAEVYFNKTIGKMEAAEADNLARLFIRPNGTVEPLKRIERAIGPSAYDTFVDSHFGQLADQSKVNGVFSLDTYLNTLKNYRPEVLEQLLKGRQGEFENVLAVMKAAPRDVFRAIASKDGDKLLDNFIKPQGGVGPLLRVRQVLTGEEFNQFRASAWKRIVDKSRTSDGQFSTDLFLGNVNRPRTGYSPPQLRTILGDQYGKLQEFTEILERIKRTGGIGANPSGTTGGVLSAGQIIQSINLTAGVAGGYALSQLVDIPGVGGAGEVGLKLLVGGMVVMHPAVFAKILYSPNGIKWLTEGFKTSPGTKRAIEIAGRLVALATMPDGDIPETKEPEATPAPSAASLEKIRRDILKDQNVPLEEKMRAAIR